MGIEYFFDDLAAGFKDALLNVRVLSCPEIHAINVRTAFRPFE